MNKFWVFAIGLLLLPAFLFVSAGSGGDQIDFRDLETECRKDSPSSEVRLLEDGGLYFSGNYPVEDSDADLDYSYRRSGDSVVLNVKSRRTSEDISYFNDCLASVVYRASTPPLPEGTYMVTVRHDGERAHRSVIKVS